MSEKLKTWIPLRRALVDRGWHYQRLEDKNTPGIPDLNIHVPQCGDWWLEMKHIPKFTINIKVGLRKEQYIWMYRASKAGRNIGLVVRIADMWLLITDPEMLKFCTEMTTKQILMTNSYQFHKPEHLLDFLY